MAAVPVALVVVERIGWCEIRSVEMREHGAERSEVALTDDREAAADKRRSRDAHTDAVHLEGARSVVDHLRAARGARYP